MRVLYHHRTQGKAVEGVHIRGIADGLRREGVDVDIISLPGADPYKTPAAMSPTRQARPYMRLVSKLPQWLFELAELGYNAVIAWRVSLYLFRHRDLTFIYERYSLFMFMTVALARLARIPIILEVNDSASVERVRRLRLKPLALWLEKWTLRHADGLVFVSSRFHRHTRERTVGFPRRSSHPTQPTSMTLPPRPSCGRRRARASVSNPTWCADTWVHSSPGTRSTSSCVR